MKLTRVVTTVGPQSYSTTELVARESEIVCSRKLLHWMAERLLEN